MYIERQMCHSEYSAMKPALRIGGSPVGFYHREELGPVTAFVQRVPTKRIAWPDGLWELIFGRSRDVKCKAPLVVFIICGSLTLPQTKAIDLRPVVRFLVVLSSTPHLKPKYSCSSPPGTVVSVISCYCLAVILIHLCLCIPWNWDFWLCFSFLSRSIAYFWKAIAHPFRFLPSGVGKYNVVRRKRCICGRATVDVATPSLKKTIFLDPSQVKHIFVMLDLAALFAFIAFLLNVLQKMLALWVLTDSPTFKNYVRWWDIVLPVRTS